MVIPLCLVSLWMAYRYVPDTAPGGVAANRNSGHDRLARPAAGRGWARCACSTAWSSCAAPAAARRRWCCWAAQCAALAAFCLVAAPPGRHGRCAADEPGALRLPAVSPWAASWRFIYGTALFGSTYLLPVYLQLGLNLSASHVGTILLPAGLVLAATIRRRRPPGRQAPDLAAGQHRAGAAGGLVRVDAHGAGWPRACGCWWPGPRWAASAWVLSCLR